METPHSPQTIEAEGRSWKEATDLARSQLPAGCSVLSWETIRREQTLTVRGTAATVEEASTRADAEVPEGMEVVSREIEVSPERTVVTVEAFDAQGAQESAISQVRTDQSWEGLISVGAVEVVEAGRKKLLGIRKASPNRYEVQLIRPATVAITCSQNAKIRATVGIPPQLDRSDMGVLYDLLRVFSAYGHEGTRSDSDLWGGYVEWWHEHLDIAPGLAEKLGMLSDSGGQGFDRAQVRCLEWLLAPAERLLKSSTPLGKDEIEARLRRPGDIVTWVIDGMDVLGFQFYRGEARFAECYEILGAVLGRPTRPT